MNTKIWLEELSFGSNFGNLRAIGSNRVWCYFLVDTLKIKKFESISSHSSRDIARSLKISFGFSCVSLRAFGSKFWQFRCPAYTFQTNKLHSIIFIRSFLSFSVHNNCARTDRHFLKKFSFFFLIKKIYTCLYLSRLFYKFHPYCDQS